MKKSAVFIGVDVSKATLDICSVINGEENSIQINNTLKAICRYLKQFSEQEVIIAMENTGRYNWPLYDALSPMSFKVYVISPLHLKRSLGLVRGKNDKVDAIRIAGFIKKHHKDLTPWEPDQATVKQLKLLLTDRRQLVNHRKQVKVAMKERYLISEKEYRTRAEKRDSRRLIELKRDISEVEQEISELINSDEELRQQATLIKSVPGVGRILAWNLLAKTNGFKSINNPRKLACYAGVAPFDFQSGTSIRKRPAVSNLADKQLKSLLHMSAMIAARFDPELKQYYERKVEQGKNKMATLNAIRNKIIHRVYAVVRNQKMYEIRLDVS